MVSHIWPSWPGIRLKRFLGLFFGLYGCIKAWMWTDFGFLILKRVLRFYTVILSIDAFHAKPSRRFYESPRRIDNWVRGSPIFLYSGLAVLRETLQRVSIILGDSMNLREGLTTELKTRLCCWRTFSENRGISCQSFSEIRRISEKVWHETHQYLK